MVALLLCDPMLGVLQSKVIIPDKTLSRILLSGVLVGRGRNCFTDQLLDVFIGAIYRQLLIQDARDD